MSHRRDPIWLWAVLAVLLAGVGMLAWNRFRPAESEDELAPFEKINVVGNPMATLTLAGTAVPVTLNAEQSGNQFSLALFADGKEADREVYQISPAGVNLVAISGDRFLPPLPLVQTPGALGEKLEWQGRVASVGATDPAKATSLAMREELNVSGGPFSSVRVDVALRIEPEGGTPRERDLVFWIVENKGIVKRQITGISTREPR